MRKELTKAFCLPIWKAYTDEKRKETIKELFEYYKAKYKLDYTLTFIPPKGFENAFANCDWFNKKVFVNPEFIKADSLFCIYNLIHEIRHAIQQQFIQKDVKFKNHNNIIKNFTYYFLYNGEALKFNEQHEVIFTHQIKLAKQFCLELYLSNPTEIDANRFAIKELTKYIGLLCGSDEETAKDLETIINFCKTEFKIFTPENEGILFNLCCELTELVYQKNLNSNLNNCYMEKEQEIYTKINFFINPTKQKEDIL